MTTLQQRFSLEDYLAYDDGTDARYELVVGELVVMPTESDLNHLIAVMLMFAFGQLIAPKRLRRGTEVAIGGSRTTVRIPDLMVLTEELVALLRGATRSIILFNMPPPALVVEVVSPGKENKDRDYGDKRSEYAVRGIPEYWIVDPVRSQITLLTLVNGRYENAVFQGCERLVSVTFPELELTADQVLNAGQE